MTGTEPDPPVIADHEHWFHTLWGHLGPYGRQDIHYHPCEAGEPGDCDAVYVGSGRDCAGGGTHVRSALPLPDDLVVPGDPPPPKVAVTLHYDPPAAQLVPVVVPCPRCGFRR